MFNFFGDFSNLNVSFLFSLNCNNLNELQLKRCIIYLSAQAHLFDYDILFRVFYEMNRVEEARLLWTKMAATLAPRSP